MINFILSAVAILVTGAILIAALPFIWLLFRLTIAFIVIYFVITILGVLFVTVFERN